MSQIHYLLEGLSKLISNFFMSKYFLILSKHLMIIENISEIPGNIFMYRKKN